MLLVAGLLLLIACLIDKLRQAEVNTIYLAVGAGMIVFSSGMLIFKRK